MARVLLGVLFGFVGGVVWGWLGFGWGLAAVLLMFCLGFAVVWLGAG